MIHSPYFQLIAKKICKNTIYCLSLAKNCMVITHPYRYSPPPRPHCRFLLIKILKIWPEHLLALQEERTLSVEELNKSHNETELITLHIDRIIERSDSYVKLFFEVPTLYHLFQELKEKIIEVYFSYASRNYFSPQSDSNDLFARILSEADRFEDNIGLMPGLVSGPLQEVLLTFIKDYLSRLLFPPNNIFRY